MGTTFYRSEIAQDGSEIAWDWVFGDSRIAWAAVGTTFHRSEIAQDCSEIARDRVF